MKVLGALKIGGARKRYRDEAHRFEKIHRTLLRLSEDLREAVILRDLEEFTYEEISDMLKVPVGTVKSRINRGRVELARLLRGVKDTL